MIYDFSASLFRRTFQDICTRIIFGAYSYAWNGLSQCTTLWLTVISGQHVSRVGLSAVNLSPLDKATSNTRTNSFVWSSRVLPIPCPNPAVYKRRPYLVQLLLLHFTCTTCSTSKITFLQKWLNNGNSN